jgi:1-acyl-sn-glycerol-3-phosphate acyltransferase
MFVILLVAAVVDCRIRRPKVGAEGAVWIHGWCKRIVRVLGFRCEVEGRIPLGGAVVSNHLSYLDILFYSSVQPFVMVAKTEVRGWPLLGWITAQAGTVYVERGGGPRTYPAVNAAMAEAYRSGLPVLFFPEGTTTDGAGVLPFRRGLFHSVLNNDVSLRTVALRYSLESCPLNVGATVGEDVCWWGEMGFASHLFAFLGLRGLTARIQFGDEITKRADRFVLSESARVRVAEMYEELNEVEQLCEAELFEAIAS